MRAVKFIVISGVLVMGLFSLFGCASGVGDDGSGASASDPAASGASSSGAAAEGQAYSLECSRRIAGGERYVRLRDEGVVSYVHDTREDPLDGDGMADCLDAYTFTALAPGTTYVRIVDVLPWMDDEGVEDQFRLVVDESLNIAREEVPVVERFELREYGDMAGCQVYSAEPSDAGFLLVSIYWEDFDGQHHEERSLNVRPDEVTAVLMDCRADSWDDFHESNSDVLDGHSFTFEASLSDGTSVTASGTNAVPEGYGAFKSGIAAFLGKGA